MRLKGRLEVREKGFDVGTGEGLRFNHNHDYVSRREREGIHCRIGQCESADRHGMRQKQIEMLEKQKIASDRGGERREFMARGEQKADERKVHQIDFCQRTERLAAGKIRGNAIDETAGEC